MDQGSGVEGHPRAVFSTANGGRVVGYLPAGVVVWGGLGKLLDHWTGFSFFTPIGLALGLILATYLVVHHCLRWSADDLGVGLTAGPANPALDRTGSEKVVN